MSARVAVVRPDSAKVDNFYSSLFYWIATQICFTTTGKTTNSSQIVCYVSEQRESERLFLADSLAVIRVWYLKEMSILAKYVSQVTVEQTIDNRENRISALTDGIFALTVQYSQYRRLLCYISRAIVRQKFNDYIFALLLCSHCIGAGARSQSSIRIKRTNQRPIKI